MLRLEYLNGFGLAVEIKAEQETGFRGVNSLLSIYI